MKIDFNKETDRLLQGYARRRRDASLRSNVDNDSLRKESAADLEDVVTHLDADELSAYAENALPVATRARYTEHLADCDSCRKLVTQLVLASGVVTGLSPASATQFQQPNRSWRESLAVMFAPRMLRYAASIMVLISIATVAFVAFRGGKELKFQSSDSQKENGSVTSRVDTQPTESYKSDQNENIPGQQPLIKPEEKSKPDTLTKTPSPGTTEGPGTAPVEIQKSGQEQAPEKPARTTTPNDVVAGNRNETRDEDFALATRQQPAAGTIAENKPTPQYKLDGAASKDRAAPEPTTIAGSEESMKTEGAKVAAKKAPAPMDDKSAANRRARRNSESVPTSSASGASMDDRVGRADGAGTSEEKRSVSGRQFVRRDGAWIDVAYRSQATTNIKRGSEQYRALIADEPGLRAIANQLSGEVIVVWKGRAYRIH